MMAFSLCEVLVKLMSIVKW